jgi:hypothetical protein
MVHDNNHCEWLIYRVQRKFDRYSTLFSAQLLKFEPLFIWVEDTGMAKLSLVMRATKSNLVSWLRLHYIINLHFFSTMTDRLPRHDCPYQWSPSSCVYRPLYRTSELSIWRSTYLYRFTSSRYVTCPITHFLFRKKTPDPSGETLR